ncbi:MAG TPA: FtsX-like permease family protein [Actinoallomurus sp.]
MSSLHLLRRSARAQWAALLTLGLLVLVTSFLIDAGPRTLVAGYDRAARETVATAPFGSTDLVARAQLSPVAPPDEERRGRFTAASAEGLATLNRQWTGMFARPLRDVIAESDGSAATPFMGIAGEMSQELSLAYSSTANGHIRYVSGRAPGAAEHVAGGVRLQAALPVRAARRLGVKAGDVLTTTSQPALGVRVTGLFTPADPGSGYWPAHHRFEDAELKKLPSGQIIVMATALVDPAGYRALCTRTPFRIDLVWTYTPGAGRVTARSAPVLVKAVQQAGESLAAARVDFAGPSLDTRFDDLLDDFVRRLHTTQALLSLSLAGLFAAALGVLVLATRLLLTRLRPGLSVQAARGASRVQLAGLTAGLASMVALPAAAAGGGLSALFVPGPGQAVSLIATAVLVVTVPAVAVIVPPVPPVRRRRRGAHRRLVAEALLVVLTVAGTYSLRRRGLTTETWTAGIDPFLSAVPVLLAVSAGLLILRLVPYPLRLAGRMLARGRSAAPFVGVARAARPGATAVLPLVIVLLTVAVIGFGSTVEASLTRTQRTATFASVGGDARADALSMDPVVVERVRRSPGVRAAVAAQTIDGARVLSQGDVIDELTAVGIDLGAYRRMMKDTGVRLPAWPKSRPGDPVPALFSQAAGRKARATPSGLALSTDYGQRMPLRNIGTIADFPGRQADGEFVLVPADALARATGGGDTGSVSIFVRGDHIDVGALRRNSAQPGLGDAGASSVSTYRMTHDSFTQGELGHLVGRGFGASGALIAGYGVLAVLVILFAGARARGTTVSYLRTLGLSRRQARSLALVEIAPTLLAASVAGWVLGLVLPALLGPAIDLRPYTGGSAVTRYVPDLPETAALAGGLLVFAGLAVLIDAAAAARRGLGGVLRIGDT